MPVLNTGDYDYAPQVIDSERDYRRCKRVLERLLFPERKLSVEEDALAKLLIHLIGVYEDRGAAPPKTTPRQVLPHLMEQRRLKQADLVRLFGTASIVSEVLSEKREINGRHARELSNFFRLPVDLFI